MNKRQIRFRAWDGKEMIYNHPSAVIRLPGSFTDGSVNLDWPLMEFTGLKDKNGTPIFEGDILSPCRYNGKMKRYNFPVIFKDGGFMLSGKLASYRRLIESLHQARKAGNDYIVIGNIFEHSHLLEGDNL